MRFVFSLPGGGERQATSALAKMGALDCLVSYFYYRDKKKGLQRVIKQVHR